MSVGNDNAEPTTTNLELSLGFPNNHCISSRTSGQGVGVNAASRVDMTYDPLSELVWSPHNGLSLKCADCSFITKSPPLIWDVGLSKFANKEKLVTSQASLVVTPRTIGNVVPLVKPNFGHFLGKIRDMDEVEVNSVGKALVADAKRKENTCKNDEEGMLSENDEDPKDNKTMDFLSLGTNQPLLHEDNGSPMPISIPNSSSPKGKNKDKTNVDCSVTGLPLERLEGTAENDLPSEKNTCSTSEERLRRGKSLQIEASPAFSKTILGREKGKKKAFSEGESSKTNSKEKDESSESVESCSSVGVGSAGKKRGRFEHQLILGSKRVKNKIQENTNSTSLMGQRSSFMNWISNMVKGLNRIDQEEEPSQYDKKIVPYNENNLQNEDGGMGFRTIFRSIYCPEPKEMETNATNENAQIGQLVLACADAAEGRKSSAIDVDDKSDNPESLWITQSSQKSRENLAKLDGPSYGSKKVDQKSNEISSTGSTYIAPSPNVSNKGVMASMFAKRLDAFKHITLSDVMDHTDQKMTCFYCGKTGHDLRNCSEITATDRDKFARNTSMYDVIDESHKCFCVKCFEVGHWAISCPKGLMLNQESHSQLGIDKGVDSTFGDDVAKGKLPEEPKGIFDAIKKLRLSRTDIHKWMNTRSSLLSLDGYFLRLRLGKWEKGQGGTGYYVACIIGEGREKQPQGFKSPISVKVGGKNCLVESQYISNQDFLEDELTAWWSTIVKSGDAIPSGDDLKVKFEERIRLGF